jgi:hypothetical protein
MTIAMGPLDLIAGRAAGQGPHEVSRCPAAEHDVNRLHTLSGAMRDPVTPRHLTDFGHFP